MRHGLLIICVLLPAAAHAQDSTDITNEYRITLAATKPITGKLTLYEYCGVGQKPDKDVGSLYYTPPGLIYRPKPWIEAWLYLLGIYNNNEDASNSWELRPRIGAKLDIPNGRKIHLFNFTRFEYRFIDQDHSLQSIPRLRNRFGAEVPLNHDHAWLQTTLYVLGDAEPIWRLDDKYLQLVRVRTGLGYVVNDTWHVEFIYYAEFSGAKDEPLSYTGNIWRLNFKLNLAHRGQRHRVGTDD